MGDRLLNSRQRRILNWLKSNRKEIPDPLEKMFTDLKEEKTFELLDDIKLLEKDGYVKTVCGMGQIYPVNLDITSEGVKKTTETFFSKLKETAHSDPWKVISVVLALISVVGYLYFSNVTFQLQNENTILSKPQLVVHDTRVFSGYLNDLAFVVRNPAADKTYYYEGGTCLPSEAGLFTVPPNLQYAPSNISITNPSSQSVQEGSDVGAIPPGNSLTLSCMNNYVNSIGSDKMVLMKICVKIKGYGDPICEDMKITVLKDPRINS